MESSLGGEVQGYLNYAANRKIADLELKFSYRFPGKGNSGVSIRAIDDPTKTRNFVVLQTLDIPA